ncbi:hypothetical protein [Paenibacillus tyrfis]|uniref:hypothetical protein n=1 Tax=Paenibacillus tyrfis TaxID=1501230 RepID=UPI0020A1B962|nr:hypothetical protein [Paenibacillus tyrfis]MCP1312123.1 hypothetical protein [Paenibacillus tyrfis]
MLIISDHKWNKFVADSEIYGFKLSNDEFNYYIRYHQEEEYPNDFFELRVCVESREISIETSNVRYSGFETNGEELEVIYDLIINGFVEKK